MKRDSIRSDSRRLSSRPRTVKWRDGKDDPDSPLQVGTCTVCGQYTRLFVGNGIGLDGVEREPTDRRKREMLRFLRESFEADHQHG